MKICIIQVGKTKDSYLEEGMAEFVKRIGPFASLQFVTLRDVPPSKTFPTAKCIEEEGEQIFKKLSDDFVVALDERGGQKSSVEFAEFLRGHKDSGHGVTFVIGGAFGLSDVVKKRADLILSFSKMTFTHQMIRLFLMEQIYRGLSIIAGKEYHNA